MHLYEHDDNSLKTELNRLWASLRLGNRSALDGLFKCFYNDLYDYGIRVVSEEEIVKDSIQELFLRLWNGHKNLSKASSVEAYLLLSLRRILLRSKQRLYKKAEYNKVYLDEAFSTSFSPEDIIINEQLLKERKSQLINAVNQLNNRQKETLFLRYYHGLSNTEISEIMDINIQSVSNHLTRAISCLRLLINDPNLQEEGYTSV